jgi:MaoC dehydratase-like protein
VTTTKLASAPSLTTLYPKAVLGGFRKSRKGELPDHEYTLDGVEIDPEHLSAYNRVCGFRLADELPATYPHMLVFPLQMALMTAGDFPFPLLGSVHVANSITQRTALRLGDRLDLRVRAGNLRDHPRGKQFDVTSEALVGGHVVWTDVSTYLSRGSDKKGSGQKEPSEKRALPEPSAIWRVPDDIGRRYGDVSGDRNPIHLHKLTAKMFGYPRAIAHGMWTKARCLAALEGRLPAAFTVDVRFKLPVLLPAKVGFAVRQDGEQWRFDLFDPRKGKPHLTGTVTPA